MNRINNTIILIAATMCLITLICAGTMYVLGFENGKTDAYGEFQGNECWIEKISNDVVCTKYIKGE